MAGSFAGLESPPDGKYSRVNPADFGDLIQMTINGFGHDLHAGLAVHIYRV
jgi:hypothetical protein